MNPHRATPSLDESISRWLGAVEEGLKQLGCAAGQGSEKLSEASAYVLLGGGKRLRALLTLSLARDLSRGAVSDALPLRPAVAIEAIHAASLVHDDLPALDNDDLRRGKPSCHKAFGEATAILVGDLLLGAALANLEAPELSLAQQARLSSSLSKAWVALCVGQQLDLDAPREEPLRERMIALKTGALFGAALECGAVCASVTDDLVESFRDWGIKLGVLFQRLDDVDDGERAQSERAAAQAEGREMLTALSRIVGRELPLTHAVAARALKLA